MGDIANEMIGRKLDGTDAVGVVKKLRAKKVVPPTEVEQVAPKNKLETLIPDFYGVKTDADKLKKEADILNAEIKSEMGFGVAAGGSKEIIVGDIKAVYSLQERNSMNTEKLLQRLKDLELTSAIKTIEVPDEKVLEDLIYRGELDAGKISDCSEQTTVAVLKVTKIKGAK